jgi:hypothetical protein
VVEVQLLPISSVHSTLVTYQASVSGVKLMVKWPALLLHIKKISGSILGREASNYDQIWCIP